MPTVVPPVVPHRAHHPAPPATISALPSDPLRYAPSAARPLRVRARRLRADTRIVPHSHAWAQVAYSTAGVIRLTAGDHTYIVPPTRAVWIPPGVEHVVDVMADADLRTLYLLQPGPLPGPSALSAAPQGDWGRCRVLEVSPLLRALVEQLPDEPEASGSDPRERCIATLVLDELARARTLPLGVVLPADKRLRALCEAVLADPARHATLAAWAQGSGASVRTVARLFRAELGTSFVQWRQQVLLARALAMAARRLPMSHIAAELGYASASAFTAMVKRSVGVSPRRFFAA